MTVLAGAAATGAGVLVTGAGAAGVAVCVAVGVGAGVVGPAVGDCMALVCALVAATARCAAALGTVTIPWAETDRGAARLPAATTATLASRCRTCRCRG